MIRPQLQVVRLAAPVIAVVLLGAGCASSGGHTAAPARSASGIGVTKDTIKIGMQFPLTGPVAITGLPQMKAVRAYFDYLNDKGGIHGRKVELDVKDNAYDATKAVAAARSLVSDGVFATLLSYGTVPTSATYEYFAANGVPDMLAYSGDDTFTNPPKDGLYVLLPSEAGEASVLADYVKANLSSAKIGVLYQNDEFGSGFLKPWQKELGSQIIATQSFEAGAASLTSQVQILKQHGVTALGFFGTVKPRILALKAMSELGWDVPFITGAGFGSAVIAGAGKEASAHVIGIDSIPPASDSQDQGVMLVKQVLDKYAPDVPLDNLAITTVAAAQLMGQLLDAAGPNPTRKALLKAADEKSFKGIWYGQVQMKGHRAWQCLKMLKLDSDGEIHAFGEVECPAG